MYVCLCNGITESDIHEFAGNRACGSSEVYAHFGDRQCGTCEPHIKETLRAARRQRGSARHAIATFAPNVE